MNRYLAILLGEEDVGAGGHLHAVSRGDVCLAVRKLVARVEEEHHAVGPELIADAVADVDEVERPVQFVGLEFAFTPDREQVGLAVDVGGVPPILTRALDVHRSPAVPRVHRWRTVLTRLLVEQRVCSADVCLDHVRLETIRSLERAEGYLRPNLNPSEIASGDFRELDRGDEVGLVILVAEDVDYAAAGIVDDHGAGQELVGSSFDRRHFHHPECAG